MAQVLIFSQMTKMLDLLHAYLEEKGHRVGRIDGSIKWQDRQASRPAPLPPANKRSDICASKRRHPAPTGGGFPPSWRGASCARGAAVSQCAEGTGSVTGVLGALGEGRRSSVQRMCRADDEAFL